MPRISRISVPSRITRDISKSQSLTSHVGKAPINTKFCGCKYRNYTFNFNGKNCYNIRYQLSSPLKTIIMYNNMQIWFVVGHELSLCIYIYIPLAYTSLTMGTINGILMLIRCINKWTILWISYRSGSRTLIQEYTDIDLYSLDRDVRSFVRGWRV